MAKFWKSDLYYRSYAPDCVFKSKNISPNIQEMLELLHLCKRMLEPWRFTTHLIRADVGSVSRGALDSQGLAVVLFYSENSME